MLAEYQARVREREQACDSKSGESFLSPLSVLARSFARSPSLFLSLSLLLSAALCKALHVSSNMVRRIGAFRLLCFDRAVAFCRRCVSMAVQGDKRETVKAACGTHTPNEEHRGDSDSRSSSSSRDGIFVGRFCLLQHAPKPFVYARIRSMTVRELMTV